MIIEQPMNSETRLYSTYIIHIVRHINTTCLTKIYLIFLFDIK